jgi:hypothetical protein
VSQARQEATYLIFPPSLARTDQLILDDWMRDAFTILNA